MPIGNLFYLALLTVGFHLISSAGCQPTGVEARPVSVSLEPDRRLRLRFVCSHGDAFAENFLPEVWLAINASANRLASQRGLHYCPSIDEAAMVGLSGSAAACLAVSGGLVQEAGSSDQAAVYLIRFELHSLKGRPPRPEDRKAFHDEAVRLQASIQALEGLEECASLNATVWARSDCDIDISGGCPSPSDSHRSSGGGGEVAAIVSAGVFVVFVGFTALAAVLLVKRRQSEEQRRRQQPQQQQLQDLRSESCPSRPSDDEPRLRSRADRQRSCDAEPQPRRRRSVADLAIGSPSWIVGPPLPGRQRISSIGWLNLAFSSDDATADSRIGVKEDAAADDRALPSRLTRFRAVGEVDEAEARRQFARLGAAVGGDPTAFYRVGDSTTAETGGLAFVLATPQPLEGATDDEERLLELIWACNGVAVSLDPDFIDRLAARSPVPSSRFHIVGWERSDFPCHTIVTAVMHCLDTNLSKRLRVCQFAGQLSTTDEGDDIPASLSEFVRFARACADHQPEEGTPSAAPAAAAIGRNHSAASLLPLLLLAERRTRLADATGGGATASCDLLRLAAGLRRQCPLAVGSEAHYLFLMRCLQAYACLMKRNSI